MWHRHLSHSDWTLAAVDDVIARGRLDDWKRLRDAAAAREDLRQRILRVCEAHRSDLHAQRYHFWDYYVRASFDEVLAELESVAGWRTARVTRPVQIPGNLNGIESGVRQLIRDEALETRTVEAAGVRLVVPTEAELLSIKAGLILRRNATRDYLDFAALAVRLGPEATLSAVADFDRLYPQPNGESALQQLQIQLARPLPYDLEGTDLAEYRRLHPAGHDGSRVTDVCGGIAADLFRRL